MSILFEDYCSLFYIFLVFIGMVVYTIYVTTHWNEKVSEMSSAQLTAFTYSFTAFVVAVSIIHNRQGKFGIFKNQVSS